MYTQAIHLQSLADRPFYSNELLICSTKGYIFALRKTNGQIIWKLQIGSSTCTTSLLITDNDTIIAGTSNKTFSIDLITGKTNWINSLSYDEEYKEVTVVANPSPQLQYQSFNTEEHEFGLPPPYELSEGQHTPYILACSKGLVTAIRPKTGTTQWTYSFPVNVQQVPVAIIEPPTKHINKPIVFIGISSTAYSLDAETGKLNWATQLSYTGFGSKYITVASSWSSKLSC